MTGPRPTDCSDRGPEGHVTQRMTTCIDGGPPRGERGGHFEAPA